MLRFKPLMLPGCFLVQPIAASDKRGEFVKVYHAPSFAAQGLLHEFAEAFYTCSRRGVLRGFHLQMPPHEHAKLVYCLKGSVFDAILDVRVGSPTFGQHCTFQLSHEQAEALYLSPGVAHAFYAQTEESVVGYLVTSAHEPASEGGIRWDSAGVPWPEAPLILSERDINLPSLSAFASPFRYAQDLRA